jgi:hypothetical protein
MCARSNIFAVIFLFAFHAALVGVALMNWGLPCERPLAPFLLFAGVIGLAGSGMFFLLELKHGRDEQSSLPTAAPPPALGSGYKALAAALVLAAAVTAATGAVWYASASTCAASSPLVHKWAFAWLLLASVLGALLLGVPALSLAFPVLAVGLSLLIGALAALATWMSEAARRGTSGAAGIVARGVRALLGGEAAAVEPPPPIGNSGSAFALCVRRPLGTERGPPLGTYPTHTRRTAHLLTAAALPRRYVNTAALVWFCAFLLLEAWRGAGLPCDAPLGLYVGGYGALGLALTLRDFVLTVFRDPIPPVTKADAARVREARKRRLTSYACLGGAVLAWGALGLYWLGESDTCAKTSPELHRLALSVSLIFSTVCTLLLVGVVLLAADYCISGKLRMVVIFED